MKIRLNSNEMFTKQEMISAIVDSVLGCRPQEQKAVADLGFVGNYVIVRCRDAGVHAGVLEHYDGRMCVLSEARRLWRWFPLSGAFLSSVAEKGLSGESQIGEPQSRIMLTENCEIALCSKAAEMSIRSQKAYKE